MKAIVGYEEIESSELGTLHGDKVTIKRTVLLGKKKIAISVEEVTVHAYEIDEESLKALTKQTVIELPDHLYEIASDFMILRESLNEAFR